MSIDIDANFYYRRKLDIKQIYQAYHALKQAGICVQENQVEEALEKFLNGNEKSYISLTIEVPAGDEREITTYLSFTQHAAVSEVHLNTIDAGFYKENRKAAFSNLCKIINNATKPLVGISAYLEYSEKSHAVIQRFCSSGNLKDLLIEEDYSTGKKIPGTGLTFFSEEAVKELKNAIGGYNLNKLKWGYISGEW